MVLLGVPLNDAGIVIENLEYEVAYFEYQPASTGQEQTWILEQTEVTEITGSKTEIYDDSGLDFDGICNKVLGVYQKTGAAQNTDYWSEAVAKRQVTDTKVVLVLERPSKSNTVIFKAGSEVSMKLALVQKNSNGDKSVFAQDDITWSIVDAAFDNAVMLTTLGSAAVAITALSLF